ETVITHFRQLSSAEIERYVDSEDVTATAGSIKAEGRGITLLEAIESSDPTTLIGLPLIALRRMLAAHGHDIPERRLRAGTRLCTSGCGIRRGQHRHCAPASRADCPPNPARSAPRPHAGARHHARRRPRPLHQLRHRAPSPCHIRYTRRPAPVTAGSRYAAVCPRPCRAPAWDVSRRRSVCSGNSHRCRPAPERDTAHAGSCRSPLPCHVRTAPVAPVCRAPVRTSVTAGAALYSAADKPAATC